MHVNKETELATEMQISETQELCPKSLATSCIIHEWCPSEYYSTLYSGLVTLTIDGWLREWNHRYRGGNWGVGTSVSGNLVLPVISNWDKTPGRPQDSQTLLDWEHLGIPPKLSVPKVCFPFYWWAHYTVPYTELYGLNEWVMSWHNLAVCSLPQIKFHTKTNWSCVTCQSLITSYLCHLFLVLM